VAEEFSLPLLCAKVRRRTKCGHNCGLQSARALEKLPVQSEPALFASAIHLPGTFEPL
jgi:hypothetical protein